MLAALSDRIWHIQHGSMNRGIPIDEMCKVFIFMENKDNCTVD